MTKRIAGFFEFERLGTNYRTEAVAGLTTFMTMAYIIIVNPMILKDAGMDPKAVMVATCLGSALACVIMGFLGRLPVALAPGMGMNAFFAYEVCGAMGVPWPVALGMVFMASLIFIILTLVRVREMIIDAVPACLKEATACGIGVFIAFIGLKNAGLIAADPATLLRLGDLAQPIPLIAAAGILLTAILMSRRLKAAVLLGILLTGGIGLLAGQLHYTGLVSAPPSLAPTFFKLDVAGVFSPAALAPILTLFFFMMFDTIGTLIGVTGQAGLMQEGKIPRGTQALFADAVGATAGSLLGTSPVTCYLESAAGVSVGGKSGFTPLVVAGLFLLALFFEPLTRMMSSGMVTAPALVVVGCLMMQSVTRIRWSEFSEAIPAFLTILAMPLTFSISKGLAVGFISYPLIKLLAGKGREVHLLSYLLAGTLLVFVIGSYLASGGAGQP